ncbi:MAG: hypothetical protein HS108_11055 [Planctomycetes bacterium]|jgi:hypothetical protein|nr:hypothetical protein [Planctomycetota bacterium]MCL4731381.1 hypothetical protein [Planctomycetota bacterium]
MWIAAANAAANTPGRDESGLELFFGLMAAAAVVVMLLWLYFRVKRADEKTPEAGP